MTLCQGAVLPSSRSSYHYKSRHPLQATLRKRIREIAETRVHYGYRRIHVLLRREGWEVNAERVYRLYTEERLRLRNQTPRRKISAKLREDRSSPHGPNNVWSMDFMSDRLFDRRRILTIVDACTRVSPAADVPMRYRGADVVDTLERVAKIYGTPKSIRVDNGLEFIRKEFDLWAYVNGVELDFSRPGRPTGNAYVESFNGKFRAACLSASWFLSLDDARSKCETWRRNYNEVRPHSSLGHKAPVELARALGQACLP